ncbi:hypothetical protein OXX79_009697, partial [Metschnikowia pulcherrima]
GFVKYDEISEYLEWYHYDLEVDDSGSSSKSGFDSNEHTIILKNHSGTLEDLSPGDDSAPSDCPIV